MGCLLVGMRHFWLIGCLLLAVSAMAQEPEKDFDLEQYSRALKKFVGKVTHTRKEMETSRWMSLATQDRTLAKAPAVRVYTISVLQKLADLDAALKKNQREVELIERRIAPLEPTTVNGKPNFTVTRQMSDKKFKLEQEKRDLEKTSDDLREAAGRASIPVIDQLTALTSTPEGKQFAMPADSLFLEVISPRESRVAQVKAEKPDWISLAVEVVSADAEGVRGYEMKPRTRGDASPAAATNPPVPGMPGALLPASERLRPVYVRGYTQPVQVGQRLLIRVLAGEVKTEDGVEIQEYVFVKAP